jgi:hypothetical protein
VTQTEKRMRRTVGLPDANTWPSWTFKTPRFEYEKCYHEFVNEGGKVQRVYFWKPREINEGDGQMRERGRDV